jgi:RHS repeat-associated protein
VSFAYSPAYIDEPVQFRRTVTNPLGAAEFYIHQNARADVVAITDVKGNGIETFDYDDFGESRNPSITGNPHLFQGQRFDPETGLYYFRNRYYNPTSGRFLQRDRAWDIRSLGNSYAFVGNTPISGRDALGLQGYVDGNSFWSTPDPIISIWYRDDPSGQHQYLHTDPFTGETRYGPKVSGSGMGPTASDIAASAGDAAGDAALNTHLLGDSCDCIRLGYHTGGWTGAGYVAIGVVGMVAGGFDAFFNFLTLGLKSAMTKLAKEVGHEAFEAWLRKVGREGAERIYAEGGEQGVRAAVLADRTACETAAKAAARQADRWGKGITPDEIADAMDFNDYVRHGDPSKWKPLGEKPGSGKAATSEVSPDGTVKRMEVFEDEFGNSVSVHYHEHIDGSRSGKKLKQGEP